MAIAQKIEKFAGLTKVAPSNIEGHETEQALRSAQYALDLQLHDLRAEFILRESKIRQGYLDQVNTILSGVSE